MNKRAVYVMLWTINKFYVTILKQYEAINLQPKPETILNIFINTSWGDNAGLLDFKHLA